MDFFKLGETFLNRIYDTIDSLRGTGRSVGIARVLRDGDQLICIDFKDAKRYIRDFHERGLNVRVTTLKPQDVNRQPIPKVSGRTFFDHRFVEEFHIMALRNSITDLTYLEMRYSGCEKHREKLLREHLHTIK